MQQCTPFTNPACACPGRVLGMNRVYMYTMCRGSTYCVVEYKFETRLARDQLALFNLCSNTFAQNELYHTSNEKQLTIHISDNLAHHNTQLIVQMGLFWYCNYGILT